MAEAARCAPPPPAAPAQQPPPGGKVCVVDLRVHFAARLPPTLSDRVFVEAWSGNSEVVRSRAVTVEGGVAPLNAWMRLRCDAEADKVHFRVCVCVRCAAEAGAAAAAAGSAARGKKTQARVSARRRLTHTLGNPTTALPYP